MIEQYLQVALEFVKEIWFQLDSQFGLEETEAFEFIHPYLLQLQDNPTFMGIAFAVLILFPFGLNKVRSISRERERKLDELMEEMEEDELDDDDPSRLRRPAPDEETETAEAMEEDELDDDDPRRLRRSTPDEETETVEAEKVYEKDKQVDPPPYIQILENLDEEKSEDVDTQKIMGEDNDLDPVSSELAEPQIDNDLSQFEEFEFDSDPVKNDSPDDPLANFLALDNDEQDLAIQELQDEMESTINKVTEKLESTPEITSTIKDLGDIRIGDGATIDEEYTIDNKLSLEEPPETNDPTLDSISLEALDLTDEVEQAIEDIDSKVAPLQHVPERDYAIEERSDRQVDSLINRLKYFQENLDTQFHHREKRDPSSELKINEFVNNPHFVEQKDFVPKAPKVSLVDNKKYLEVLESFIFLKDQNKH